MINSTFTVLYCEMESYKREHNTDNQESCLSAANISLSSSPSKGSMPRYIYGSNGFPIAEYNYRWNKYEKYL